jgi:inward rectifier potassium channel
MATRPPDGDTGDLGLGSRLGQSRGPRFLNRDGSFNVRREGLSPFRSLSVYHALLTMPWTRFFGWVVGGYFAANLLFAGLYLLCGEGALHGTRARTPAGRFAEAFFFSVQTLATIGYGGVSPASLPANLLVTFEALVGLLGFALATGLLFARFSRPEARVVFSESAVVTPYRGISGLMFRLANERSNQLVNVELVVTLSRLEGEGARVRRFHALSLERSRVVFFPLHWVVVHPIDETSPLHGVSEQEFAASDAELLILLTAFDETFSQTVHARSSYKPHEVAWGARFAEMFLKDEDGNPVGIDMSRLHAVERLAPGVDGGAGPRV